MINNELSIVNRAENYKNYDKFYINRSKNIMLRILNKFFNFFKYKELGRRTALNQ